MRTLLLFIGVCVSAADWPTYRGDDARSGVSPEQLKLPLKSSWIHQPLHDPRPAWRGPAKADLYNKQLNLKNRQLFDHAFHVIADRQSVYFGSSADDQVHCLDLNTGKERWSYFTEGPVRLAPTLSDGHLFVGSDDGHAYCLSTDGKLIWRQRLASSDYRIAGNNRIISAWPLRTGILVRDGIAYAGAGMFPSEGVHVVAFNANDGKEKWRTTQTDLPAQGYMLLSKSRVYVPAGRNNPVVFDQASGKIVHKVSASADTFTLIKWNEKPLPNPRQSGRMINLVEGEKQDSYATFTGNRIIVDGGKSYLQAHRELSVLDRARYLELERDNKVMADKRGKLGKQLAQLRKQKSPEVPKVQEQLIASGRALDEIQAKIKDCVIWRTPCDQPHALILAGDTLFAGGNNEIVAYSTVDGKKSWSASVRGVALGIAVAHGRLLVSTDQGTIHCFTSK